MIDDLDMSMKIARIEMLSMTHDIIRTSSLAHEINSRLEYTCDEYAEMTRRIETLAETIASLKDTTHKLTGGKSNED